MNAYLWAPTGVHGYTLISAPISLWLCIRALLCLCEARLGMQYFRGVCVGGYANILLSLAQMAI